MVKITYVWSKICWSCWYFFCWALLSFWWKLYWCSSRMQCVICSSNFSIAALEYWKRKL